MKRTFVEILESYHINLDLITRYGESIILAAEEYANQPKWIFDKTPELIKGQNYSENVLAEVEGLKGVQVMCYIYVEGDDVDEGGFAWANCYGDVNGDAEFDDDYKVIKWQSIPKI